MCVCKEALSVSTRKGTNICEFAQQGFIYKTIHDTIKYLSIYVYKDVLSVSTRNGTYKCEIAQHGLIYKRICDGI